MIIFRLTKSRFTTLFLSITLLLTTRISGQDSRSSGDIYPEGITFSYGTGLYSIKDKYISDEKYSGILPYYSVGWARNHNKYVYRLDIAIRTSDKIKNYTVPTEITRFVLSQGFLYPLKNMSLFNNDLRIWIGPSTEFYVLYNKPDIAVSGFDYAQSYAGLISLGFNADVIYPLNQRLHVESSLGLTLLSLGLRMVDNEEDERSPFKPLTCFSGLNSSYNLRIMYYLSSQLSILMAYRFEFVRIAGWEKLISASDNILIGFNYKFRKENK
jgi:hypothetical protein